MNVDGYNFALSQQYAEEAGNLIKTIRESFNSPVFTNRYIKAKYTDIEKYISLAHEIDLKINGNYTPPANYWQTHSGSETNTVGLINNIKKAAKDLSNLNTAFNELYNKSQQQLSALFASLDGNVSIHDINENNKYIKQNIMTRINELRDKKNNGTITKEEQNELDEYEKLLIEFEKVELLCKADRIEKTEPVDMEKWAAIQKEIQQKGIDYEKMEIVTCDNELNSILDTLSSKDAEYIRQQISQNVEEIPTNGTINSDVLLQINSIITKKQNSKTQISLWESIKIPTASGAWNAIELYYNECYNKGIRDETFINYSFDYKCNFYIEEIKKAEYTRDISMDEIDRIITRLEALGEPIELDPETSSEADCDSVITYIESQGILTDAQIEMLKSNRNILYYVTKLNGVCADKVDFKISLISENLPPSKRTEFLELMETQKTQLKEKMNNNNNNEESTSEGETSSISLVDELKQRYNSIDIAYQQYLSNPESITNLLMVDIQVEEALEKSKKSFNEFNLTYDTQLKELEEQKESINQSLEAVKATKKAVIDRIELENMAWYEQALQGAGALVGGLVEGVIDTVDGVLDGLLFLVAQIGDIADGDTKWVEDFIAKDLSANFYAAYADELGLNQHIAYGGCHSIGTFVGDLAGYALLSIVPYVGPALTVMAGAGQGAESSIISQKNAGAVDINYGSAWMNVGLGAIAGVAKGTMAKKIGTNLIKLFTNPKSLVSSAKSLLTKTGLKGTSETLVKMGTAEIKSVSLWMDVLTTSVQVTAQGISQYNTEGEVDWGQLTGTFFSELIISRVLEKLSAQSLDELLNMPSVFDYLNKFKKFLGIPIKPIRVDISNMTHRELTDFIKNADDATLSAAIKDIDNTRLKNLLKNSSSKSITRIVNNLDETQLSVIAGMVDAEVSRKIVLGLQQDTSKCALYLDSLSNNNLKKVIENIDYKQLPNVLACVNNEVLFTRIAKNALGYNDVSINAYLKQLKSDASWDAPSKILELIKKGTITSDDLSKMGINEAIFNTLTKEQQIDLIKTSFKTTYGEAYNSFFEKYLYEESLSHSSKTLFATKLKANAGVYNISADEVIIARMNAKNGIKTPPKKIIINGKDYTEYFPVADEIISDKGLINYTKKAAKISDDTLKNFAKTKGLKYDGNELQVLGEYLEANRGLKVKMKAFQTADPNGISFATVKGNYLGRNIPDDPYSGGIYTLLSDNETMAKNFPKCCKLGENGELIITNMKKFGKDALSGVVLGSDGVYMFDIETNLSDISMPSVNNLGMFTAYGVPGGELLSGELEAVITSTDIIEYIKPTGKPGEMGKYDGNKSGVNDNKIITGYYMMEGKK